MNRPQIIRRGATYFVLLLIGVSSVSAQTLDRTKRPAPSTQAVLKLPPIEMRKLSNGVEIAVMQDHRLPVVSVSTIIDIPPALDPAGKTGLSSFVGGMLSEGTKTRTAEQIADASAALGTRVSATGFYTITANMDGALELMADQLLNPAFPQASLERVKANAKAGLRRQKDNPQYIAGTIMSNVLYGANHPYARQMTEANVDSITRDDVVAFFNDYYRPPNIKFIVVGDVTPEMAVEKLNKLFGALTPGKPAKFDYPEPKGVAQTAIYLFDRPNSPQSIISISAIGPRFDTPDYHAIQLMNTSLGGAFISRLNLNLREKRGYAYGASSSFSFRRVPQIGTFGTGAAVQTSKTDSAIIEFVRELKDIRGDRPLTQTEFDFARSQSLNEMPLQFETVGQRANAVNTVIINNLPLDYYETIGAKLAAVTMTDAQNAAQKYVNPDKLVIVVVGDRKLIEAGIRATNVAPVFIVNDQGEVVTSN